MDNKALMLGAGAFALFVGVLLLLAIVQMLFRGKLRLPGGRSRQARLGIVDAFDLDRQRQLIIVRRDNTEHLIMIGGPNDLLIEAEISRVESRENRRDKFEAAPPSLAANPGFTEPRILAPYAPVPERLEPQTRLPEAAAPVRSVPLPPVAVPPASVTRNPAPAAPAAKVAVDSPPRFEPSVAAPQPGAAPAPPPASPLPAVAPAQPALPRGDVEKRAAAFALPPRRLPLTPAEPRPAPKPPEADKRPDPAPAEASAPMAAAPSPASSAPLARAPSQFLRPLPPRPAFKPGVRPGSEPVPPPAPQPAASPRPAPQGETLDSIEEEMAKLLGRGAGEN